MDTWRSLLCTALLPGGMVNAQINAGDVPPGTTAIDFGIDLILNDPFTSISASLELDCDDQPEVAATLIRGEPMIDAPNIARLDILVPDVELCMDLAPIPFQRRPQYHSFGQALDCAGAFSWQGDSVNVLGDFGTFTAIGPIVMDSVYVAFRQGGTQVGWILLSFDLNGGLLPVRLTIHEWLQFCGPTGMDHAPSVPLIGLYPDGGDGSVIHVQGAGTARSIEVLDMRGRPIALYGGNVRTIRIPTVAGIYLVQAVWADGQRATARLIAGAP